MRALGMLGGHGRVQAAARGANFPHGLIVFCAQGSGAIGEDVAHDPHAMPDVIEHHQAQKKHHHGVVHAHVIAPGIRNALDQAHHVIREIADGARDQRRQARHAHGAIALHAVAQIIQWVRLRPGRAAIAFQHARAVHVAKHFGGVRADERIARNLFAALDAFQQAGVPRVMREPQVGGNRRERVGRERVVDGHQIALPREFAKRFEVRLDHF